MEGFGTRRGTHASTPRAPDSIPLTTWGADRSSLVLHMRPAPLETVPANMAVRPEGAATPTTHSNDIVTFLSENIKASSLAITDAIKQDTYKEPCHTVTAKIRSLYDAQLRLQHNIQPLPLGTDIANTVKYFSQTLLSVLKDVPRSPLEMLRDADNDSERMGLYPNLDYKSLFNALSGLVDSTPHLQYGTLPFGQAILQCLGCLLPFLEYDMIDNLPFLVAYCVAMFPVALHQEILHLLSYYILPFTITRKYAGMEEESQASQSVAAIIMMVFQHSSNPAHHCQLLECLMSMKQSVVKDILCVIAYGTWGARLSAAKLLFYYWPPFDAKLFDRKGLLCKFSNDLVPFLCQRDMCPNAGSAEAAKVCYDHCISVTFASDSPPPLYLCIECANEIHREHPNQRFFDILHPQQQVSMVCENKNCRSTDKAAYSICFSNECASYNGNHPIRYCQQCHGNRHNSRRGGDHVVHTRLPLAWQMDSDMQTNLVEAIIRYCQTDAELVPGTASSATAPRGAHAPAARLADGQRHADQPRRGHHQVLPAVPRHHVVHTRLPLAWQMDSDMQTNLVEAIISLLKEAKPINMEDPDSSTEQLKPPLSVDLPDPISVEDRQLLGRYGVWLMVGLCTPNPDTPDEILGRLLSVLFHWFHVTSFSYTGETANTVEKLKWSHVCGWVRGIAESHRGVLVACLLPHPPHYTRQAGHWDNLASKTQHLKDGLNRYTTQCPLQNAGGVPAAAPAALHAPGRPLGQPRLQDAASQGRTQQVHYTMSSAKRRWRACCRTRRTTRARPATGTTSPPRRSISRTDSTGTLHNVLCKTPVACLLPHPPHYTRQAGHWDNLASKTQHLKDGLNRYTTQCPLQNAGGVPAAAPAALHAPGRPLGQPRLQDAASQGRTQQVHYTMSSAKRRWRACCRTRRTTRARPATGTTSPPRRSISRTDSTGTLHNVLCKTPVACLLPHPPHYTRQAGHWDNLASKTQHLKDGLNRYTTQCPLQNAGGVPAAAPAALHAPGRPLGQPRLQDAASQGRTQQVHYTMSSAKRRWRACCRTRRTTRARPATGTTSPPRRSISRTDSTGTLHNVLCKTPVACLLPHPPHYTRQAGHWDNLASKTQHLKDGLNRYTTQCPLQNAGGVPAAAPAALHAPGRPLGQPRLQDAASQGRTQQVHYTMSSAKRRWRACCRTRRTTRARPATGTTSPPRRSISRTDSTGTLHNVLCKTPVACLLPHPPHYTRQAGHWDNLASKTQHLKDGLNRYTTQCPLQNAGGVPAAAPAALHAPGRPLGQPRLQDAASQGRTQQVHYTMSSAKRRWRACCRTRRTTRARPATGTTSPPRRSISRTDSTGTLHNVLCKTPVACLLPHPPHYTRQAGHWDNLASKTQHLKDGLNRYTTQCPLQNAGGVPAAAPAALHAPGRPLGQPRLQDAASQGRTQQVHYTMSSAKRRWRACCRTRRTTRARPATGTTSPPRRSISRTDSTGTLHNVLCKTPVACLLPHPPHYTRQAGHWDNLASKTQHLKDGLNRYTTQCPLQNAGGVPAAAPAALHAPGRPLGQPRLQDAASQGRTQQVHYTMSSAKRRWRACCRTRRTTRARPATGTTSPPRRSISRTDSTGTLHNVLCKTPVACLLPHPPHYTRQAGHWDNLASKTQHLKDGLNRYTTQCPLQNAGGVPAAAPAALHAPGRPLGQPRLQDAASQGRTQQVHYTMSSAKRRWRACCRTRRTTRARPATGTTSPPRRSISRTDSTGTLHNVLCKTPVACLLPHPPHYTRQAGHWDNLASKTQHLKDGLNRYTTQCPLQNAGGVPAAAPAALHAPGRPLGQPRLQDAASQGRTQQVHYTMSSAKRRWRACCRTRRTTRARPATGTTSPPRRSISRTDSTGTLHNVLCKTPVACLLPHPPHYTRQAGHWDNLASKTQHLKDGLNRYTTQCPLQNAGGVPAAAPAALHAPGRPLGQPRLQDAASQGRTQQVHYTMSSAKRRWRACCRTRRTTRARPATGTTSPPRRSISRTDSTGTLHNVLCKTPVACLLPHPPHYTRQAGHWDNLASKTQHLKDGLNRYTTQCPLQNAGGVPAAAPAALHAPGRPLGQPRLQDAASQGRTQQVHYTMSSAKRRWRACCRTRRTTRARPATGTTSPPRRSISRTDSTGTLHNVLCKTPVACLLPHPPHYTRQAGHWDNLASKTQHLKDGLNRLYCLIPYGIITQSIWDYIMPAWMEAICTDVPEKELMELKVPLGKILEPEGTMVGVDEKNLYKFAVLKVTNTPTPDTVLPVLEWFQTISMLEVRIPLSQLFDLFSHCVVNLPEKIFKPPTLDGSKPKDSKDSPNNDKEKKDKDDQIKPQNLTCCILMLDILLKQLRDSRNAIVARIHLRDAPKQPAEWRQRLVFNEDK
uniref:Protein unc-79 homolog n=1 Tax=Heliothis virescens TaxID=7102 RepID=A0A2A4J4C5_HELVI